LAIFLKLFLHRNESLGIVGGPLALPTFTFGIERVVSNSGEEKLELGGGRSLQESTAK
jgi:hypothetical protein